VIALRSARADAFCKHPLPPCAVSRTSITPPLTAASASRSFKHEPRRRSTERPLPRAPLRPHDEPRRPRAPRRARPHRRPRPRRDPPPHPIHPRTQRQPQTRPHATRERQRRKQSARAHAPAHNPTDNPAHNPTQTRHNHRSHSLTATRPLRPLTARRRSIDTTAQPSRSIPDPPRTTRRTRPTRRPRRAFASGNRYPPNAAQAHPAGAHPQAALTPRHASGTAAQPNPATP